jgi:hypothetical protein
VNDENNISLREPLLDFITTSYKILIIDAIKALPNIIIIGLNIPNKLV